MIWCEHFVSASAWKKFFGKPCCDKPIRTTGTGSAELFRDAEQAVNKTPIANATTPVTGSFGTS